MSSAIVSHISRVLYVKWTETVTDNCRHARFYATTRIRHTTATICPRWTYFFNPVYQMDQDGHIRYVRQSEQYQKSLHPQCLLFHSYIGEIIALNIKSNHAHFHSRKYIRKCRLQNGHHVFWARSVFVYVQSMPHNQALVQFFATQQECLFNTMLKLMQKRQSSVLLSLCEDNPSVTSEFLSQRSTNAERRLPTMMRHSC